MKRKASGGGHKTSERAQGKPPGGTGANKPMPPGRDFRKTAARQTVRKKSDQKGPMP